MEAAAMSDSPGPWTWEKCAETDARILRDSDGDSVLRIHENRHSRLPSKADARLIAAAPELLAMLKRMVTPGWNDSQDARDLIARIEDGGTDLR
jgi:hypothetical protein